MEPSPPCPALPSPLARGEKSAKVPSGSFANDCVALTPNLKRYALVLTKHSDDAEDLIQDTLVRALSKQHLWASGTNLRAWLFTLMHNTFIKNLRKHHNERELIKPDADLTQLRAADRTDIGVIARDVRRTLAALPKSQRDLALLAAEGLRYEEIATETGIVKNTVRSALSRARAKIRDAADENSDNVRQPYEHIELGIYRSFNQYVTSIGGGKTRYFATLQEARDARAG